VQYHRARGEDIGIVTAYGVQAEATLEALRDVMHQKIAVSTSGR
jgi:hypothetical protein